MEATAQFTVENPLDMLDTVVHTCNSIALQKEDAMNLKTVFAKRLIWLTMDDGPLKQQDSHGDSDNPVNTNDGWQTIRSKESRVSEEAWPCPHLHIRFPSSSSVGQ